MSVRVSMHIGVRTYVCACVHAASGSTEDIGALSLALQIIDASQELQETVVHLKKLMPGTPREHADQMQPTTQGKLVWCCCMNLLCSVWLHSPTRDIRQV